MCFYDVFRDIERHHQVQSQERHQNETNRRGGEAGIHLEDVKVIDHTIGGDHLIERDHQNKAQGAPDHLHFIASHQEGGPGKIEHFQI